MTAAARISSPIAGHDQHAFERSHDRRISRDVRDRVPTEAVHSLDIEIQHGNAGNAGSGEELAGQQAVLTAVLGATSGGAASSRRHGL